jgi:hypothetical protein
MKLTKLIGGVAGVALAVGVTGCGTTVIDGGKAEKTISKLATSKLGVTVKDVKCPSDHAAKKGDSFTCTMTLANGESELFRITPTDDKGNVSILPADMIATYVENTIVQRLGARGVKATSVCPQHVPVVVGNKFSCTITASNGQHGTVAVKITGDNASFLLGSVKAT